MTFVNRVFNHSCESMSEIPDGSVHCIVTSPPYWGLRTYKGDDGMIGLEPTLDEHIGRIVDVFREARRVLRPDGVLWLNYGDAYNAGTSASRKASLAVDHGYWQKGGSMGDARVNARGLKPKDLIGMPWRVAFALQADGWYLRSDIVWNKPNPMPESVSDRPTRAHEYIFLLAKSQRYFYDADAIREPLAESSIQRIQQATFEQQTGGEKDYGPDSNRSMRRTLENFRAKTIENPHAGGRRQAPEPGEPNAFHPLGANKRDVWTIASQPYPGSHFATFPPELVRLCVSAGSSQHGACAACGAPYKRETNAEYVKSPKHGAGSVVGRHYETGENNFDGAGMPRVNKIVETTGWSASCECNADVAPCVVLDPFMGSGTVAQVANELGRSFVGYEISAEYCDLIRDRLGLFGEGVA